MFLSGSGLILLGLQYFGNWARADSPNKDLLCPPVSVVESPTVYPVHVSTLCPEAVNITLINDITICITNAPTNVNTVVYATTTRTVTVK